MVHIYNEILLSHKKDKFESVIVRWWKRKWQPIPVFLPGEFRGWRSMVDCCPWGCKDLDMTEVT